MTENATCETNLVALRDRPDLIDRAALWFHSKWEVPAQAYRESMELCVAQQTGVPQWYAAVDAQGGIVAGAGVIDNDFHERKDLAPNLCALFVEEGWRGQGLARRIMDFARRDMAGMDVDTLYPVTDLAGFYEQCGWRFLGMACDDDGCLERMYVSNPDF